MFKTYGTRSKFNVSHDELNRTLFVYKSKSSINCNGNTQDNVDQREEITFTFHDQLSLQPPRFLNDTVISFFMRYHLDNYVEDNVKNNIYIFNSFFFAKIKSIKEKLLKKDSADKQQEVLKASFTCASRWLKNVKLFRNNFLIMPVCDRDHWLLVIICYPARDPSKKSSLNNIRDEELHEPAVIVLNSSYGYSPGIKKVLSKFLEYQWMAEYNTNKQFNLKGNEENGIRLIFPKLPQQRNNYNCGVFMLNYFYCFLKSPRQAYVKMFRGRDMTRWFEANDIDIHRERKRMQDIVMEQKTKWESMQKSNDSNSQSNNKSFVMTLDLQEEDDKKVIFKKSEQHSESQVEIIHIV